MKKIFIDSDVFVLDLRYGRDKRGALNRQFLERVRSKKIRGVTSIFNLLEVCGILSFNLSEAQLLGLYADFCHHYGVQLLFPADAAGKVRYEVPEIFAQIQQKQSLGDAQITGVVERFRDHLKGFVSWNASHFAGRMSVPVMIPSECR